MAFIKKTWVDRLVQYPMRRILTKSDGTEEVVTVARDEGTVFETGDPFNAQTMNDLEDRIDQALENVATTPKIYETEEDMYNDIDNILPGEVVFTKDDEEGHINASDVDFDNTDLPTTETDLQGAVSELYTDLPKSTIYDTPVNMSTYTSSNPYTAPNDGYLKLAAESGATVRAVILDSNGNDGGVWPQLNSSGRLSVYVKKGLKIYRESIVGTASIYFVPFE